MEQKAKRIGKFNIIDIIAVILILAVLAFVGEDETLFLFSLSFYGYGDDRKR